MAYSLRLPDALDAAARAKADYLGISLNALLCVALDAYLRGPPAPQPAAAPSGEQSPSKTKSGGVDQGKPSPPIVGDRKPTRAEK